MSSPRAQIMTIANQKGGVGKTTLTMNLGSTLAARGRRVLLVDSDPQANLTSYLAVTPGIAPFEETRTLDEIYLSKRPADRTLRAEALTRTQAGVDLIAGDKNLTGVDHYLFSKPDRERILSRFLDPLREEYDYILIDTPPSLNLLTINALCASDRVLIPVQPEFFSLEGIVKLREAIDDVRARWNPRLEIGGVIANQVSPRRKLTTEVVETLRGELGELFYGTMIHDSAGVAESAGHGRSVAAYDRGSRGARDFDSLTDEFVQRQGASPDQTSEKSKGRSL